MGVSVQHAEQPWTKYLTSTRCQYSGRAHPGSSMGPHHGSIPQLTAATRTARPLGSLGMGGKGIYPLSRVCMRPAGGVQEGMLLTLFYAVPPYYIPRYVMTRREEHPHAVSSLTQAGQ